jgi:signal transduction histidine kinase/ligand-binding sensor domain-containing protein/DNA-binding response OmpR family regulator
MNALPIIKYSINYIQIKKSFCLFYFFYFLSSFVYARHTQHPEFLHIGIEDGLSNGSITSIVQDSLGFIWIGTKYGLNRYDGTNFKLYSGEQNNLPGNDISVLHIDNKNRFWIGTIGEGLFLYDPVNDNFERILLDAASNQEFTYTEVHALFDGKDALLWIATEVGLYSYDIISKRAIHYRQKSSKSDESGRNVIRALAEAPDEKIWLGTFGYGLCVFDTKFRTFKDFNDSDFSGSTINSDHINSLFVDKNGHLLIGTDENGLKQIDFQKKKIVNYLDNTIYSAHAIIRCIRQDQQGDLWIGTDGIGILHIEMPWRESPLIQNYRSNQRIPHSLSCNTINTFFVDRQSNMWIGTAKKGINLIKKEPDGIEYYYSDGKGENKLPILSVFHDKRGLWMGTDGEGMTLLDLENKNTTFFNKASSNGYIGDFVQCIKPSINGSFWIGTYAHGLYLFDSRTRKISRFNRKSGSKCSLPHNDVRDFVVLPSGDLWIATWGGGLAFLDSKSGTIKEYKHEQGNPNSLGSNNILALCPDEHGQLWLATYGGGLSLFNPVTEKFKNFKTEDYPGLTGNFIFALLLENEHTLWLGTKEGLCRLNLLSTQFETVPIDADYPSKTIMSLLKDNNGNIWAGTKKGILRLEKGCSKIKFLPSIYDSFSINSACMDEAGKLYFGGDERVVAFHPSQISFDSYRLPFYLTNFLLFNKPVLVGSESVLKHQICYEKKVTLKHNQSVITIGYAVLDFPFSRNINYEVMLEGLEKEWRNVGKRNTVTFTNLSPGKYTFKMRPAGDIFTNNETLPARLDIHVLPPFLLTRWAYLLYALLLAVLFYLLRRYTLNWVRIRNELKLEKIKREQEERMHQMKQRFFINISHDIRTPLTLIAGSVNKLFNRGNTEFFGQKHLTTIKANTNRLLNLTEELLNYRKLETGNVTLQVSFENLVEFVKEIYICYSQFAVNKKIEYKFSASHPDIYVWMDKIQIEKAICNLISNAFKFTKEGGKIKVEVNLDSAGQVVIRVTDTGKGIAPEKIGHIFDRFYQVEKDGQSTGFGIGLSISHEIVLLHGGKINVSSEVGRGSEFSITLQSGKDHFENAEFVDPHLKDHLFSEHFIKDDHPDVSEPVSEGETKEYSLLVVEDNLQIRSYIVELLSFRYQVYEASNGREALEATLELIPDLVVSDVMMPVMDGITFCYKLKTDMRISHIPVILLTARTLTDSFIEGFESGADDYLTKPFNERLLLTRISNILRTRREIREGICREMILNPQEVSLNVQDGIFLSRLVGYIEEHLEEADFNVMHLAAEMAMSHSNLYKKVKALTGMSVIGFVKDFRLKKAAQLLIQNELYITEIAYMIGYSERRHFSKDFKIRFNLTPKEYIEKHKNTTH